MRKRITPGDVVEVRLSDTTHSYARVLTHASYGFYDFCGAEEPDLQRIVELPIIFFAAVRDSAVKSGRWPIRGHVPLDGKLVPPPKFIQDPLQQNSFSIYQNDGTISEASRSQCVGLERAAVWDPEQIEDRLQDHFAGRSNKWLDLMKMK